MGNFGNLGSNKESQNTQASLPVPFNETPKIENFTLVNNTQNQIYLCKANNFYRYTNDWTTHIMKTYHHTVQSLTPKQSKNTRSILL